MFTFVCSEVMFVCLSVCGLIFICLRENVCVYGGGGTYTSVCVFVHKGESVAMYALTRVFMVVF